jgi:hypothetical protein
MRNIIGCTMERMNSPDEINILTESRVSGALQKEDSHDSMESRKPTLNII